jgi:hypothetical protein
MMRPFDVQANIDAACAFLGEYLASSGQQRYVTGLSGGSTARSSPSSLRERSASSGSSSCGCRTG